MMVSVKPAGIGHTDITSSGGRTEKNSGKEKSRDTFADLMNLVSTGAADSGTQNVQNPVTVDRTDLDAAADMVSGQTQTARQKQTDDWTQQENTKTDSGSKTYDRTDVDRADRTETSDAETKTDAAEAKTKTEATGKESKTGATDAKTDTTADPAVQAMAEEAKKILGIDDETLQKLLEEMGATMQDLLNPDTLTQLALDANNADSVDLLINESLSTTVSELQQALTALTAEGAGAETVQTQAEDLDSTLADVQEIAAETEDGGQTDTIRTRLQTATETDDATDTIPSGTENRTISEASDENAAQPKVTVVSEEAAQTTGGQTGAQTSGQPGQTEQQVLVNFSQAVTAATAEQTVSGEYGQTISQADIIRQVVDEIKLNLSKDVTSMTVQLNPEQLGKVQIHVSTKNGVMQAQILAENEAAKNAVEAGIAVLKEAFENQDLKVDAVEVMVATPEYFAGQEEAQDAETGREKQGNRSQAVNYHADSDDEVSKEQTHEQEMMKVRGNQVSYTA